MALCEKSISMPSFAGVDLTYSKIICTYVTQLDHEPRLFTHLRKSWESVIGFALPLSIRFMCHCVGFHTTEHYGDTYIRPYFS